MLGQGFADGVEPREQAGVRLAAIGGQGIDEAVTLQRFDSAGVFATGEAGATETVETVHFIHSFR